MDGLDSTSFSNGNSSVNLASDLDSSSNAHSPSTQASWKQAMADAGLGGDGDTGDMGWGNADTGQQDSTDQFASSGVGSKGLQFAANVPRTATMTDAAGSSSATPVSDHTGQRYPVPYNPLGVFIPGSPENEDWTRHTQHTLKGLFKNQSQEGTVNGKDGTNNTSNPSGASAAAGATPPEEPDDAKKQERFRARVDRQLDEVQEMTDNASYEHLKDSDLDAARRELNGEVVVRRADGKPFDHIDEVIGGQRSLMNGIQQIKSLMKRVPINTPLYARLENMLGRLSSRLDYSCNFVPRGTASPSNPDLTSP